MLKRSNSTECKEESGLFAPNNFLRMTFSKIVSNSGFGIIGLMSFSYKEKYPLYFYMLSAGFAFILHFLSLNLISKLSVKAKLSSIVGVSAIIGPFFTYTSIFLIFTALVTMSGLSLKYSIYKSSVFFEKTTWTEFLLFFVFGIIFYGSSRFFTKRKFLYPWSKLMLGSSSFFISSIVIVYNLDAIRKFLSKTIPLQVDYACFREFLSIQSIVLGALFLERICDESILKKLDSKHSDSVDFVSLIISSSFSFLIFCVFILKNSVSIDENDNFFTKFLRILVILSCFIQSLEFFDCAHNLIFGFFQPVFRESVKLLENEKVREIWLTFLVLALAYSVKSLEYFFSAMTYLSSFTLSLPFLIFPAFCLVQQSRKQNIDADIFLVISGILLGIMGSTLFASILLGIQSLQNNCIRGRMLDYISHFFISVALSAFIYILVFLLDIFFYPRKAFYATKNQPLLVTEPFEYGKNYCIEAIICTFIIFTIFCKPRILETKYMFLEVLYTIPRTFVHSGPSHLINNSIVFYSFGKIVSAEIGPFHLLGFMIVSNIFSSLFAKILELHMHLNTTYSMIGASGGILAVISYYFYRQDIKINLLYIKLTGHEFGIFYILISILFILTNLESSISHSGHLFGIIYGILFWQLSIKIWQLRDVIQKKYCSFK